MSDENITNERPETTYDMPDSVGPNFHVSIAPNGYIRYVLADHLVSSAAYCDGDVARTMAKMLERAADEFDRIWAEIEAEESLAEATNVISLEEVMAEREDGAEEETTEEALSEAVEVDESLDTDTAN